MLQSLVLFAQENAAKDAGGGAAPGLGMMLPFLLILGFMYFIIILPAQRREKRQREELKNNLKKNDEVVLQSGIIGVVQTLRDNDDEVTLRLEGDAKVRVLRSAIAYIKQPKAQETAPSTTDIQEKKA